MAICSRSDGWVDFITQNDRRIPLHLSGRCNGAGEATSRWGRSEGTDSACFKTLCPEGCRKAKFAEWTCRRPDG